MAKINDTTVIFNTKPADFSANRWLDASVTGNGRVTASVLGAYCNEEILIGRVDLKHGGYTGVLQDVSDKFPNVRKLYNDGKIIDAEKLLSNEFAKKGYNPQVDRPLPLCIIGLDFGGGDFVTGYRRTVDMQSGEVEVAFRQGSTQITRGLFVGRNNDILAYNVSKNGADKINVNMGIRTPDGINLQNAIAKYEGGFIYFAARSAGGSDYGLVARLVSATGGAYTTEDCITLKNSDGFMLLVKTFVDSSRDAEFRNLKNELMGIRHSYEKLLGAHESAHGKLFGACTLQLGMPVDETASFAGLLSKVGDAELDSGLVERLWNFGKYLVICGFAPEHISFNNSAQIYYGGIVQSIVPDAILNLFEYFEKYIDDLKKNSARVFGMKGYFVPSVVSPKSALFGSVDAGTIHFIASSALAANLFYSYYLASGDIKTLKSKILPFMREVCAFYSDFLKLDTNGFYTTVPSYSPSSTPGNSIAGKPLKDFAFATNSTIDFLAIGSLLDNLIEAATTCGAFTADVPAWQDMKTKIPPLGVNDMGALREYIDSPFIDGAVNCGTMHGYGLWPLKSISFNDVTVPYKPAVAVGTQNAFINLRRASYNTVANRIAQSGALQNAQVLTMAATQVAHGGLGDVCAEQVENILLKLLASTFTTSGLCLSNDWRGGGFTKHGGVKLDVVGNVGFSGAITECIVQSDRRNLRILPSIFESLSAGKLTDAVTDFGARVTVDWDLRKNRCVVKIVPRVSCKINVEMCQEFKKMKNKDFKDYQLTAGKTAVIEFA